MCDYTAALHGDPGDDRIVVTSAGVNGLMLAMQLLVDPGDEVLVVAPVWPNLPSQPLILGGVVKRAALRPDAQGAWRLDLQALLASITPATWVLLVNAPQPHRLDADPRRATGDPGALPPHGHVDRGG